MSGKSGALAPHFADLEQQQEAAALGMWIFLATEVMFFGGLFTAYTIYRHMHPVAFEEASAKLNLTLGATNTVVLLTSSLTMALAVYSAQVGRRGLLTACLAATALLGAGFLAIKAWEYHGDYADNLIPGLAFDEGDWQNPERVKGVKMFFLLYYLMTGVHALHLIAGITLMAVLTCLARRGRYGPAYHAPVEVGGLYWHFVDVIWIFLLPLLYMVGVR